MTQDIKSLGMIHIPGVNDEAYATYINNLSSIESNNLWFTLPQYYNAPFLFPKGRQMYDEQLN